MRTGARPAFSNDHPDPVHLRMIEIVQFDLSDSAEGGPAQIESQDFSLMMAVANSTSTLADTSAFDN